MGSADRLLRGRRSGCAACRRAVPDRLTGRWTGSATGTDGGDARGRLGRRRGRRYNAANDVERGRLSAGDGQLTSTFFALRSERISRRPLDFFPRSSRTSRLSYLSLWRLSVRATRAIVYELSRATSREEAVRRRQGSFHLMDRPYVLLDVVLHCIPSHFA